ncbi:hypothetical protein BABINDRAFT_12521 [Babjeviella inositovora NRRL Y-12698]|uniref:F-box domain-containing protein n=1 Tax=Babjeviella inositovora NRRL Y-12698 TaxID=984486 RepID=A0A1E3QUB8_9ASCO|nr:uncharacterized protein BABINDRAFT_12521 [Babjeviella inositovora NRRL Y-12698]ODQ81283.1 hypothetical protein BABINDRAFT_12521 [Babjeviella inositovora NRRL Y-12698]
MDSNDIPLIWDTLPLEISEKIFSHLPLTLISILMKSENASIASMAQKCYYSNIKLFIDAPFNKNFRCMNHDCLYMTLSEFEELAKSDILDQLRIKKLSTYLWMAKNNKFLQGEVFTKKLVLVGVRDFSVEGFNGLKLPNLRDLQLRDIHGVTEINELFELPSLLENLDLSWPEQEQEWDLSFNKLQQFSKTLPDSIKSVSLWNNLLEELVNFHLPVNCTTFILSSNPLQKIQITNADDPDLKLRSFELNGIGVTSLHDISPLPQSLTFFEITGTDICSLSEIQLPAGLKYLDASNNKITLLENAKFPSYLETLLLLKNEISSLTDTQFPDSLLKLELNANKLASIEAIQLPPKLKVLHLQKNAISTINELQLPDSLEETMSEAKITEIHDTPETDIVVTPEAGIPEVSANEDQAQVDELRLYMATAELLQGHAQKITAQKAFMAAAVENQTSEMSAEDLKQHKIEARRHLAETEKSIANLLDSSSASDSTPEKQLMNFVPRDVMLKNLRQFQDVLKKSL